MHRAFSHNQFFLCYINEYLYRIILMFAIFKHSYRLYTVIFILKCLDFYYTIKIILRGVVIPVSLFP